ncbi:hypothetical protein BpHYR1_002835 [Brachionus plicatilis]|uniref:Uncharacterized protein n=1 Tax=Brachionus plicatilis TaxID=10195 RepID=A0A3M7SEM3_BRAPC|nr:hypothetical protein BpHYR1_002835 [Brachionus plicatilis]
MARIYCISKKLTLANCVTKKIVLICSSGFTEIYANLPEIDVFYLFGVFEEICLQGLNSSLNFNDRYELIKCSLMNYTRTLLYIFFSDLTSRHFSQLQFQLTNLSNQKL